jgi:hypothetical protein
MHEDSSPLALSSSRSRCCSHTRTMTLSLEMHNNCNMHTGRASRVTVIEMGNKDFPARPANSELDCPE